MYRVQFYDGESNDFSTLEEAQESAYHDILSAAAGEGSTYYEPVEIVEIREGINGGTFVHACELGFDPVIQPDEPACLHGDDHNWEDDENMRNHGGGHTWSRTCLNCAMVEYHDTWHDDGYGGVLRDWVAYGYYWGFVVSREGVTDDIA